MLKQRRKRYTRQSERKYEPCVRCGMIPVIAHDKSGVRYSLFRLQCGCSFVRAPSVYFLEEKWKTHNHRMRIEELRGKIKGCVLLRIAKRARVSPNALYAIRSGKGCCEKTRLAILQAMEEMKTEGEKK